MATTIWLVRHGATEWSQNGRHTGSTDLPLLPEGRERATAVAPVLAANAFALVLTSPLQRARETAALAGFAHAEVDTDLLEWDYGDYEGVTTPTIRETDPGWSIWDGAVPGGESADHVAARVARVIARADAADGDVLLFAHKLISPELVARMKTWKHSGFNVHSGRSVPPENRAEREQLCANQVSFP